MEGLKKININGLGTEALSSRDILEVEELVKKLLRRHAVEAWFEALEWGPQHGWKPSPVEIFSFYGRECPQELLPAWVADVRPNPEGEGLIFTFEDGSASDKREYSRKVEVHF